MALRLWRQFCQCVDLSFAGLLEGAVFLFAHQIKRRDPVGEIVLPCCRRPRLQFPYLVEQADEAPFHHVALCVQPGLAPALFFGRQVCRLRDGGQADACSVHQLLLRESTDEAHLLQGLAEAPALRASEEPLVRSLPMFDLLSAPNRSTPALDCES